MNIKQNMTKHHPQCLLGVFAHPNDETFCAGGTFAKYIAHGAEVLALSDMPTWYSWKSIYTPLQDWNGFRSSVTKQFPSQKNLYKESITK